MRFTTRSVPWKDFGSEERLLDSDTVALASIPGKGKSRRDFYHAAHVCVTTVLFFTSLILFTLRLVETPPSVAKCNEIMEMPSPVHAVLNDDLTPTRFNGHFWEENAYKGPPTQDRDAAWDDLINNGGGIARISEETRKSINASEHAIRIPQADGGGYMASFEVTHQLHCIQFIREWTYRDHYRSKSPVFADSDETVRVHLDHCIDMIRQKLMCDSDAGLVTFVWVKNRTLPYADFNVQKKCRNYTKVQEYVKSQYIPGFEIAKPPGAFQYDEDI